MATVDRSYIGVGEIFLVHRTTQVKTSIGNCSKLTLSIEEESKKLKNYMALGGGSRNEISRISSVGFSITLHDLNTFNIALALRAEVHSDTTHDTIELLTAPQTPWGLEFQGLNEAQGGEPVELYIHKGKFNPLSSMDLIGDDFAGMELKGSALQDDLITGIGLSRYAYIRKLKDPTIAAPTP